MYTYKQWDDFCLKISCKHDFKSLSVIDSFQNIETINNCLVLKHDVEDKPEIALNVAKIEAKYNLHATYYFHGFFLEITEYVEIMIQIQNLGHEVGYHYDVLDNNDGDYEKAANEFKTDLVKFKSYGINIKSICPHGNPLKVREGWNSNKDFFKLESIRKQFIGLFDIVNDIRDFDDAIYISDAGYKLNIIGDIRDNDKSSSKLIDKKIEIENVREMLNDCKCIVLSIHPHRMRSNIFFLEAKKNIFFLAKIIVLKAKNIETFDKVLSMFYRFSKRF